MSEPTVLTVGWFNNQK